MDMAGTGGARFKAGASDVLGDPTFSVTNFDKVCFKKCRERERDRDRDRGTETEAQRQRETETDRDRQTGRETETERQRLGLGGKRCKSFIDYALGSFIL